MATGDAAGRSSLSRHIRGHLLLFDRRTSPEYPASVGARLLLTAVLLEAARLAAVRWIQHPIPLWLLVPVFLALALLSIPFVAGLRLLQVGLRRWREWTRTETSYFLQVVVAANIVFPVFFAASLRTRVAESGVASTLSGIFLPYLAFGFYQEVVYRGMVQLELVRRWGALAGILAANVLYTFGPLHWNYFSSPLTTAVPMFAAIFGIGLFFGVVFLRSGNLWIVAVFHAIGNAYIIASQGPVNS